MVVELKTLKVTSDFDAAKYVAGMDAKVAADRRGADSSKATGAAVEEQKIKVSSAVPLLERLSRTYVDGYGTAAKFNAEILRLARSQDTAGASTLHLEKIYQGMQSRFGMTANATELASLGYTELAQSIETVNGRLRQQQAIQSGMRPLTGGLPVNDNMAQFRRQNLGFQVQDIGVSLYGGMPVGTVLLQQGSQILGLYQGNGGVNAALKDFGGMIVSATKYLGPFAAAGAAAWGAYKLLASYSVEAGLAVSETTRALAAQAAPIGTLQGQIGELAGLQDSYNKAIRESAESSSTATDIIIANTEREFNAKKSLLELEQKRLQASMEVQRSEIAIAQQQLKAELASTVNTRLDLDRQGFGDSRVGRFVALPDDVTGLDKTRDILQNNPLTDKIKELRANLELTEIGAQKLDEALKKTFTSSPYGSGDLPIIGPIPGKNPRFDLSGDPKEQRRQQSEADKASNAYRDLVKSAQDRISQMRLEAQVSGQTGVAAERLRFQMDLLQKAADKGRTVTPQQRQEIERLGGAYETAARQAASLKLQADAAFERQQLLRAPGEREIASQLRGAGLPIDLSSYEAGILRANDALRDQVKAWEDIRDIGRDAIDQITGSALKGFDNIEDVLKNVAESMLKQLTQLSIANPLKNAIYGDQLPTLDSVGGVGGMFGALLGGQNPAAARNASAMTVNAASVVINGSVTGGLGSVLGGLGGAAANENNAVMAGTMSQYAQAIKDIESFGGNYRALGPITANGDRAYGAYQVMGANVGPWSRAALGKSLSAQEFLANPSFQDQIFSHRFGGYVGKYGASGAAQAWFGGPGSVGGSGSQADLLGTTGTEYVNKFNDALGRVTSSTDTAAQGLGTFGGGLGAFGDILSQAVGGGAGEGSFLENFFMTFLKSFSQNMSGYASGTESAAPGWAWVGERGPELMRMRGGEVIRNHAASMAMAGGGRTVVNRQVIINNAPPGYHAEVQEEDDGYGNEKVNVTFSKLAASEANRPGSPFNRTLRSMGVRGPRKRM